MREELLARCRVERLEPPAGGRIDRIIGSALRLGEKTLTLRVSARLSPTATEAILALVVASALEDPEADGERSEPTLLERSRRLRAM